MSENAEYTLVTMSHTVDGPEGEGSTPNKRLKTRYGIWEHL
jgi:hypothetical protein